jgi:hypothetical protein
MQFRLDIEKLQLFLYITKLCELHKRKFPKLAPKILSSFVNEAPGGNGSMCTG